NDPTLMFTNAGMNQFKDYFLGNKDAEIKRVADTQKCLRVSGKHNDLEEVGRDSYHHTMFEMLGNWSFGDYFKTEAISWAWELLTEVYKLDSTRIYATVFGGDDNEGLGRDEESAELWRQFLPKDRILYCGKEDNFWEMGETGPCGPCSELHVDLRSDEERAKVPGRDLVNIDDPMVIEIWNLVFIQFNRNSDRSLENLPAKHIDTGMGFERLCLAMQAKTSNYETDIFLPMIQYIEKESGITYTNEYAEDEKTDIAMRVIVDHVRAVSFTIADGQLPSNTGAGYVIRRILRRAVRYYYSFLNMNEPFLHKLVPMLAEQFKDVFPELEAQREFVEKVVLEEEKSFLRTLAGGLRRIQNLDVENNQMTGKQAFELYDTYGFPIDLTRMIAEEHGWQIDDIGFEVALEEQRVRGRDDGKRETGDWVPVHDTEEVKFYGYDEHEVKNAKINKYRTLKEKGKPIYQVVLDKTPFYAEGGGQVGDKGEIIVGDQKIIVYDTKKENDLIIHFVNELPSDASTLVDAKINATRRVLTENNHSATHLLHAALRQVLGTHVQQKGSLVKDEYLRFDFSHFEKVSTEQLKEVEQLVNSKIRENISLIENRNISVQDAKKAGAMMLFGEKYGEFVRMITFDEDFSRELCGGCHVDTTGQIGLMKITSESAIAAGVRRIEAITAKAAEKFVSDAIDQLTEVKGLLKNPKDLTREIQDLQEENKVLKKEIEKLMAAQAGNMKEDLIKAAEDINGVKVIRTILKGLDSKSAKSLAGSIEQIIGDCVILFGIDGKKPQLQLSVSRALTEKGLHAGNMVSELAKNIKGGGGGQSFYASAGG
ncbi:alanine--tRNA ligase, partial [Saprospiraceae bacterium]|nr:alanine--tRNA ligase [Saprospiraceae bacterium]